MYFQNRIVDYFTFMFTTFIFHPCMSLFSQVVVWRLLQDRLPLSVDLQWALSCLCLALQQPCVWNKLSTPEYTTHTCSLIYCLRLIIVAGEEATRTHFVHSPLFSMVTSHDCFKTPKFCVSFQCRSNFLSWLPSGCESWRPPSASREEKNESRARR